MDINALRKDFQFLKDGKWIYFDNACQSLRPRQVVEAVTRYYNETPVCAGRSNYRLAVELQDKLNSVRQRVAKFIGAKRESEIVFTRNTTEGINLVANSFALSEGDSILLSDKEHNSNIVPWLLLAKTKKIKVEIVNTNPDNTWNWESFEKKLNSKVKLVSLGMISNLDGVTIPFKEIIARTHKIGVKVLLDGAQWVGHHKTDVAKWNVDFLVFSGHKILGPSGTGVLYGKESELNKLSPYQIGGNTVADTSYEDFEILGIPDRFEAGLRDYAGILGLGEAIKYLESVGWDNIEQQEEKVTAIIMEGISKISGIEMIGPKNISQNSGIVSFYHPKAESHQISIILDQVANIMIRSGRHYVHSWFNARGIKDSVRISSAFYNTSDEAKKLVSELQKIIGVFT